MSVSAPTPVHVPCQINECVLAAKCPPVRHRQSGRRVSFPEGAAPEAEIIGEADWDYDRSSIEVQR